jgi:hypothetical protein
MTEPKTCVICKMPFTEYGNNPEPFNNGDGQCCDHCNDHFVVPVRMIFGRNLDNETVLDLLTNIASRGAFIAYSRQVAIREHAKMVENAGKGK